MVYTIAAYTITIGTLALYGVLIRYRQRVAVATLARAGGATASDPRRGFNLGAALLAPFWMWRHGMRLPGALLFVVSLAMLPLFQQQMWLPLYAVAMVLVAAGAALGLAGNRIAVEHLEIDDPAAFASSQLPWAIIGIVVTTVVLPWTWFFLGA